MMCCVRVQVQVWILAREFMDVGEISLHPQACLEGGSCNGLDNILDIRERARLVQ